MPTARAQRVHGSRQFSCSRATHPPAEAYRRSVDKTASLGPLTSHARGQHMELLVSFKSLDLHESRFGLASGAHRRILSGAFLQSKEGLPGPIEIAAVNLKTGSSVFVRVRTHERCNFERVGKRGTLNIGKYIRRQCV
jgi:hypothetical protein